MAATLAALGVGSGAAKADSRLDRLQGHIAFGYGKLFAETAPGGSISFAGGVEHPVGPQWSAGVEVGYWLLGTRLADRGSFGAQLDYSVFEASAIARWTSPRRPLQLYVGPGVFHALADLTTSAPAGFEDLAIARTVGGATLGLTVIQNRPSPVRVGLELAARELWLPGDSSAPVILGVRAPTWNLLAFRLAIHY